MAFDWIQFLEQNNIHYVDKGPNVSAGNICVRCIWCGQQDDSEHLSINLEGRGFRCWRQPLHSGKNPAKLVQALLNCSWAHAVEIAGQGKSLPSDFMSKVRASLEKAEPDERAKPSLLFIPSEFKPFLEEMPSCRPFASYLRGRGFTEDNIFTDTLTFGMYYATQGLYNGRVIFTVQDNHKLVGWTGRTIYPSEEARYKTLTNDPVKAKDRGETPAPGPITDYLLFWDDIRSSPGKTIVLCEGPFDAWRLNLLGWDEGIRATACFTSSLSDQQTNLLYEVIPDYKNRFLLLDQGTFAKAERIRNKLTTLDVVIRNLPSEYKDPAEVQDIQTLKGILGI
jgi:hypothetical protein